MRLVVDLQSRERAEHEPPWDRDRLALVSALARRQEPQELWIWLGRSSPNRRGEIALRLEGLVHPARIVSWEWTAGAPSPARRGAWRARAEAILSAHRLGALGADVVLEHACGDDPSDPYPLSPEADELPRALVLDVPRTADDRDRRRWLRRASARLSRADLIFAPPSLVLDLNEQAPHLAARQVVLDDWTEDTFDGVATRILERIAARLGRARGRRDGRRAAGRRPRLAFVSPLPPPRTGIADEAARILPELDRHYDLELIVDQAEVELPEEAHGMRVRDVRWFHEHAEELDRVVYQMGNSWAHAYMLPLMRRRPGIVRLHDFHLAGLMTSRDARGAGGAAVLHDTLYESHGYGALLDGSYVREQVSAWTYPCNGSVIAGAEGVIVHGEEARERAELLYGRGASDGWAVVPRIHRGPPAKRREDRRIEARRRLGLGEGDWLACSFGFVTLNRFPDRIIRAWSRSKLERDPTCRFLFVGHNMCLELLQRISKLPHHPRVAATGYLESTRYRDYLAACDVAVQLRSDPCRGVSRTTLDCLADGVPTIVDRSGARAVFPEGVAFELRDGFTDEDLAEALERLRADPASRLRLSHRAVDHVREVHSAANVARAFRDAVERLSAAGPVARRRRIVREIAEIPADPGPSEDDLAALATTIVADHPSFRPRQLFVDVSRLLADGAATIETRSRLELRRVLADGRAGWRIEPVYRDESGTVRYARRFTMQLLGLRTRLEDEPIEPRQEDSSISLEALAQPGDRRRSFDVES